MAMTYKWKADARFPVGAQIAAERMAKIKKASGGITPRAVVDDARPVGSPLHKCFEWDDAKAAEAHRLSTARNLIGALVVVSVDSEPVDRETRAFVHVTTGGEARYEPVATALSDADMRQEVLDRAQSEILRWRERYAAYEEFAAVHAAVDRVARTGARVPGKARRGVAAEEAAAPPPA